MPAGQYLATGFMYLNLGCHMMFVLKNRLKAQGIPADKSTPGLIQPSRSSKT